MEDHLHAIYLGKLMANLHSLEYILRTVLSNHHRENTGELLVGVTKTAPLTHFTNYDSLSQLIGKYNNLSEPKYHVDKFVVSLRDAVAHGRVFTLDRFPLRLLKFDKPQKNGNVAIVFDQLMDEDWFKKNVSLVREQIEKVVAMANSSGMVVNYA